MEVIDFLGYINRIYKNTKKLKIIEQNIFIFYYNRNGELYRDNRPAKILSDGSKEWWENDKFIKKS